MANPEMKLFWEACALLFKITDRPAETTMHERFCDLRRHLVSLCHDDRAALFDTASQCIEKEHFGTGKMNAHFLWFFSHPTFSVFEEFIHDETLCETFAAYLSLVLATISKRARREKLEKMKNEIGRFAARYSYILTKELREKDFRYFSSTSHRRGSWHELNLFPKPYVDQKSLDEATKRGRESTARGYVQGLSLQSEDVCRIFQIPFLNVREIPAYLLETLFSRVEVMATPRIPSSWRPLLVFDGELRSEITRAMHYGQWLKFKKQGAQMLPCIEGRPDSTIWIDRDLNQRILSAIREIHNPPTTAIFLKHMREVRSGLLPIGLKIHCVNNNPKGTQFLRRGGFAAHNAGACFNLPPVGSIEALKEMLSAIEEQAGMSYLNNPDFQIQVCNPGELTSLHAAILGIAFYLGSDRIRRYKRGDFETTHKSETGDRLIIYGAGEVDNRFEWWKQGKNGEYVIEFLPTKNRTDVLSCQSLKDIEQVNLVATLLIHIQHEGYWKELGLQFVDEIKRLLGEQQLSGLLDVQWVKPQLLPQSSSDHESFWVAFEELMDCAFQDAKEINHERTLGNALRERSGILFEMQRILHEFASELKKRSSQARSS